MNTQTVESGKDYSKLTSIQQQRYDLLFDIYGPNALDIVTNVYGKGKNSWPSFLEKMDAMLQAKKSQKEYYEALYEALPLHEVYTPGQIISNVATVRRELGLTPYTEKIKIQSENDFNSIFLSKEAHEQPEVENGKKVFKGYVPVAKVQPE